MARPTPIPVPIARSADGQSWRGAVILIRWGDLAELARIDDPANDEWSCPDSHPDTASAIDCARREVRARRLR